MPGPSKKRMRSCHDGKRRYDTKPDADAALVAFLKRRQKQGTPIVTMMQVYGCACGGFHFGRTRTINWDLVNNYDPGKVWRPAKPKRSRMPDK